MQFGHKMLKHFYIDNNYTHINHGSLGASPIEVLNSRFDQIREQEKLPERFFNENLFKLHIKTSRQLAEFVGAEENNICMIDNTTTGINSCLISAPFSTDSDIVLIQPFTYKATRNAALHISKLRNFSVKTLNIPFDKGTLTEEILVNLYEEELKNNPRIKLIILDYISCVVPIIWPVEAICNLCRSQNVLVLIDGAHAPGQVINLNLDKLQPDYFVASLHKWNYVPRSCGMLYVSSKHQKSMHNVITSDYFMHDDYRKQFQFFDTRDLSSLFCWEKSRNFVEKCGGLNAINEYNKNLVDTAAEMLCEKWNTVQFPIEKKLEAPYMKMVKIPPLKGYTIPIENGNSTFQDFTPLFTDLLYKYKISSAVYVINGNAWVRISSQIYNEIKDYEKLAETILMLAN